MPPHTVGNYLGGPNVNYTFFHYDTTVSETRIAYYIAIARGQIPRQGLLRHVADLPGRLRLDGRSAAGRQIPHLLGVTVFEGAYRYRGMRIVPWLGRIDVRGADAEHVRARGALGAELVGHQPPADRASPPRARALRRRVRVLGILAGQRPDESSGYREYGVDAIGLNPDGYFSDVERTNYDRGYRGCPLPGTSRPTRIPDYGDGVVTPHALFLAMHHEPRQAYDNLRKLQRNLDAYGEGGFYDAMALSPGDRRPSGTCRWTRR